ncbi:MAG: cytochrome c [Verrucomicrobiaceae bacterium]|nr:cytochrome c [Verrucomicrobiaceae bacterium]
MSAPAHPDSTDLDRIHSAVKREKADKAPENAPAPMWASFLLMIVAVVAGGQLGPNLNFSKSNPYPTPVAADDIRPLPQGEVVGADPFQMAIKKGGSGYAVCGGCHQGNGMGIPGSFPPLAGSEWVTGGTERLIRVAQHGLTGAITVKGQGFNTPGGMMPFGAAMSAQDLANVLTYVRNTWGNEGTMITKEMVEKVRAEEKRASQWTEADLKPFADKNVPGDIPAGPGATAAK